MKYDRKSIEKESLVSIEGAVDLHVHTGPSVIVRAFNDVETAHKAAEAGMQAIVLKDHFECTSGRAWHTSRQVPEIKVFAGIVLNRYVGGVNPIAVETALLKEAKQIWMPTVDSSHHAQEYGTTSTYQVQGVGHGAAMPKPSSRMQQAKGISILKDNDLTGEAKDVVNLVAEYDVILATGHISKKEVFILAKYAKATNFEKVLITHPDFDILSEFDLQDLKNLVENYGTFVEFTAATVFNPDCSMTIEKVKEWMEVLGPDNCVISSDSGAPFSPMMPEVLRIYGQELYQVGVSKENLRKMMVDNPKRLLGL